MQLCTAHWGDKQGSAITYAIIILHPSDYFYWIYNFIENWFPLALQIVFIICVKTQYLITHFDPPPKVYIQSYNNT